MKKPIRIEKSTVLTIIALMLTAMIIPAALANVTNLSFVSATPTHVQPGDTVTITYKFMVDKPTQDVRVQVLSGLTVISEVLIGYTGGSGGSAPTDTWIEKTIAVAIPLSAPVGPYDVVIQARQPDGGAYDVVLSVAGLVTVDPPPIAACLGVMLVILA